MRPSKLAMAVVIVLSTYLFSSKTAAKEGPLFKTDEPLELILEADLVALINDKSEDPEYTPGLLIQPLEDRKIKAFQIKVKPRGNTRRLTDLCDFPPLKLNFKKSELEDSEFEGQDKLKFVSQCRQKDEFQNYVLEEYLLYKSYNILTEESYKVRLVNITLKDIKLRIPAISMTGFLIEDDETLSKRLAAKEYEEMVYFQDSIKKEALDRMALFQFMIGNTDWYINTKHNMDVFEIKLDNSLIPVPFDFDFSGVINTEYASPSKEIPITRVTQRYYKGSCRSDDTFDNTIQLFKEKRDELYELYNSFEHLPKYVIKKSIRYYDKFYKILNDPVLMEESVQVACSPQIPHIKNSRYSAP